MRLSLWLDQTMLTWRSNEEASRSGLGLGLARYTAQGE